jgi:peroxiredoxin
LNDAREEIEATGARILLIGQATPRHAAHYQRRYAPELEILADSKRESYKAMKLPRAGTTQLIGPKSLAKGIVRGASGVGVGRPIGDVSQLGATMVVLPGGEIAWSHIQGDASDNPSIEEVMTALTETLG